MRRKSSRGSGATGSAGDSRVSPKVSRNASSARSSGTQDRGRQPDRRVDAPGEEVQRLREVRDVGRGGVHRVAAVEEVDDRVGQVLLAQRRQAGGQFHEVLVEAIESGPVPGRSYDRRRVRAQRGDVRSDLTASPDRRRHRHQVGDRQRDHHETAAGREDRRQLPAAVAGHEVADAEGEHGVSDEVQPVDEIGRHTGRGITDGSGSHPEHHRPAGEDHRDPHGEHGEHDRHARHRQHAVRRPASVNRQRRTPEPVRDARRHGPCAAAGSGRRPCDVQQGQHDQRQADEDRNGRHARELPPLGTTPHGESCWPPRCPSALLARRHAGAR
jgi:hypothetical protein